MPFLRLYSHSKSRINPPLTNPIKHMDLPQGTYAVYIHQGDYALLDAFYEIILKQLPQSYCLGETQSWNIT